jgi:hypothetical protein
MKIKPMSSHTGYPDAFASCKIVNFNKMLPLFPMVSVCKIPVSIY